ALSEQIPVIKEMLRAWGIPVMLEENYEADDVVCSAARKAAQVGIEAVIVTTDKDVEQCIDDHISVLHLHKNKEELLDRIPVTGKKPYPGFMDQGKKSIIPQMAAVIQICYPDRDFSGEGIIFFRKKFNSGH
ncbi:MAG: hypothetical protein R6V04_12375, partial [bacterium]